MTKPDDKTTKPDAAQSGAATEGKATIKTRTDVPEDGASPFVADEASNATAAADSAVEAVEDSEKDTLTKTDGRKDEGQK